MSSPSSTISSIAFTGERVVPQAVEPQLWNEHVSRYHFAQLFATGKCVLDVGCGTGYGTELLAERAAEAVGFDLSPEAIQYATEKYGRPRFLLGSADSFPIRSQSCGVITAFEVIEHIHRWPDLVAEAARALTPDGIFLVSTPNKHYYAETREDAGPNPFHVHEFDLEELERSLREQFAYVSILSQNQTEAIVFAGSPDATSSSSAWISPSDSLPTAHFFLAICSHRPVAIPNFTFISNSGNLLREREHYIELLKEDVRETHEQHLKLLDFHNELHRVLAERSEWGSKLEAKLHAAEAKFQNYVTSVEAAKEKALSEPENPSDGNSEATRQRLIELENELNLIRGSRWLQLGQLFGIGPYNTRRFRPRVFLRSSRRRISAVARRWLLHLRTALLQWTWYLGAVLALPAIALALLLHDLCFAFFGRRRLSLETAPRHAAASIIIPTWNGSHLLARYLPSVLAAVRTHPGSEVIVVDNASTDGSAALLRSRFPEVRIVSMPSNVGFARAANKGAELARNEVIVLLNNDMRVEPEFLSELLSVFADPLVFAASSQIFFSDPKRRREETGLTEVWWDSGRLRVGHRVDSGITQPFPCAYPGGGSSAFDRRKFLELGGMDPLFHPFYYEDTDLGRMAWTRGWKVLYVPKSVVHHEHRATVGKLFTPESIDGIVRKNALLYGWKNLADWRLLLANFWQCLLSLFDSRWNTPPDALLVGQDARLIFRQLPELLRSRWQAKTRRAVTDWEAFRRPMGGYFRDLFLSAQEPPPERLNVLFAAPYPIAPAVHGGAVFMKEALTGLQRHADVHLVSFVDTKEQLPAQESLRPLCKSAFFMVRPHVCLDDQWTLVPNAVREFGNRDFAWAIHRTILQERIDILQLEYTILGQYAADYLRIPCMLFEHDISSQSLRRRIRVSRFDWDLILEYVRMRIYEPQLLKRFTRVQVCSEANSKSLLRLTGAVQGRVDSNVRAGIDVRHYEFRTEGREPDTLLFIGSFRHSPNIDALRWFKSEVLPAVLAARPQTILYVVGSDWPESAEWIAHPNIRLLGAVPDVAVPLLRYTVFLCPIQSGSGVRVKLLEAFASGIPAVSTTIGAEGLANRSHPTCELADSPSDFAAAVLRLLSDRGHRTELAHRARNLVMDRWDARAASDRLIATYCSEVERLRLAPKRSFAAKS